MPDPQEPATPSIASRLVIVLAIVGGALFVVSGVLQALAPATAFSVGIGLLGAAAAMAGIVITARQGYVNRRR